jgi:hypothetical protein
VTNGTLTPVERRRRTAAGVAFLIGLAALIATIAPVLGGGSSPPSGKQASRVTVDPKEILAREERQKKIDARRDRAAAKRRKAANKEWKAWKKQADALKNGTTEANAPSQGSTPSQPTQQQAPATSTPQQQTPAAPQPTTPATPATPQQQAPSGTNDPRYYRGE